jgi:ATP-binding cassette subfamily A (ABC1) protein 1
LCWVPHLLHPVQGAQRSNMGEETDNFKLENSFVIMFGTTIGYLVLTWYLDNVWPSEYGVPKHPLFCFYPSK